MKLLNIIISTRNRPKILNKLIDSLLDLPSFNEKIELFIIDDNSNISYDEILKKIENKNNIRYYYNKKQLGKVKSILTYKKCFNGKYILSLDDKDEIINFKFYEYIFRSLETSENKIFIGYYEGINKKIIGEISKDGESYFNYYFKKGKTGDHLFFIPNNIFQTFTIPSEIENVIINDELVYLKDIFYTPTFNFNEIKPIALHDYRKGNLTKNIFTNKINNWITTKYCSFLVLKSNPCLKIRIIKLFELFLIRHQTKLKFNKKNNLFLYYLLKYSGMFLLIKKIYIRKINNLIKSEG